MKHIFILLLFSSSVFSFQIPRGGCKSDLYINNEFYGVSDTYEVGDAVPTDAYFDSYGNLFYVKISNHTGELDYNIYIIKSGSQVDEAIPGLPKGRTYSIAINKLQNVCFGTDKGIYKYSYEANEAILITKRTFNVKSLMLDNEDNQYFTQKINGKEELYLLGGERKIVYKSFEELDEVAIDNKNNFYFIRQNHLFVLNNNLSSPVIIGNVTYDGVAQISFYQNTVFLASNSLTYFHENDTGTFKFVRNAPNYVSAIAFDKKGNIIIGVPGKLMLYKKNECSVSM